MNQTKTSSSSIARYFLIIILLAAILPGLFGQEDKGKHQFIMYLTAPTMTSFDESKSNELEIGDKAWTMEIGVQTKLYGLIGISGAIGYGGAKDNNSFSQNTTWGTLESSFSTLSYDFKAGIWTPPLYIKKGRDLNFSAGLSTGYEGFSGSREIVNCEDCKKEKYKFNGGLFIEPEMSLFFYQSLFGVATSYRYFFGASDLTSSWTILKLMVRFDLLNQ